MGSIRVAFFSFYFWVIIIIISSLFPLNVGNSSQLWKACNVMPTCHVQKISLIDLTFFFI